jgi:hypothetical protein
MNRLAIILGLLLMIPVNASAEVDFGGQLLYGDDADLAIGARIEIDTPELQEASRLGMDFNWFFPDDPPGADLTFWTANLNWLQRLGSGNGEADVSFYLGAGLNFAYAGWDYDGGGDGSEKDLGVNLLGGLQLPLGALTGIGELKITIAGSEQYTLGIGLLF